MAQKEKLAYPESRLYKIRHSAAHVMAQAVLEIFPTGKIAIGPPIEEGFYYDFDLPRALTPDDLKAIEKRMRRIIKKKHHFASRSLTVEEARELFQDQPYKLELIEGLAAEPIITTYKHDTFEDLCKGPHVEHLGEINPKAVKLLTVAGAYWRGDENQAQLQRIYGTAWESVEDLKAYLWRLEEARKRDNRRLGRELDLFSVSEKVGPGLILWHPKGGLIRRQIESFWEKQHEEADYEFVYTPHIGKSQLWETSGHLDFYAENMYAPMDIDGQKYYLKPMNCPFHIEIYQSQLRSYRELPLRFAEKGTVYRYERSGVLHGLMRVRGFTQDDAHHFCRLDQMDQEIDFVLDFSWKMLQAFGLNEIKAYLSTRPEKAVGDEEDWQRSTAALRDALDRIGLPYEVDEGGGAFYGPKIDLAIQDALGREWQMSTIQFDFNLPERFDIHYIGQDGQPHRPYMIHRALLGSIERFFGILLEHYGGAFPVWLAPVQVVLIPIADRHLEYAEKIAAQFKAAHLRAVVDDSAERMGNKIRKAQKEKIPCMLIIGDREVENEQVSVRLRSGEDMGAISIQEFVSAGKQAIETKALDFLKM